MKDVCDSRDCRVDGIMVSPTGARLSKLDHVHLPISSDEIAAEAKRCFDAGARALHLHVRDRRGRHSLDAGRYREAMSALAETAPEMAVQITTESGGLYDVAAQAACLREVEPSWASVALREMERDVAMAARLYGEAGDRGTEIQHILYEPEDIARLFTWQQEGLVPKGRLSAIFVLGRYGEKAAQPSDLNRFLTQEKAHQLDWMACAFGKDERACLLAATAAGGKVRIGFENNIHHPDGQKLENNAQSVRLFRQALAASKNEKGTDRCRTYSPGI